MDDYVFWKMWWIATLYGAAPDVRMAMMGRARARANRPGIIPG